MRPRLPVPDFTVQFERRHVVRAAVAAVVVLVVVVVAFVAGGGGASPGRLATTTVPDQPSLNRPVRPDPRVADPQPVAVEAVTTTGGGDLLVSAFLLPCQRIHSVNMKMTRTEVVVRLKAGIPRGASGCDGDLRLVTTEVVVPGGLGDRTISAG